VFRNSYEPLRQTLVLVSFSPQLFNVKDLLSLI